MSFGYKVLGFGSGGGAAPYTCRYLVCAGGGGAGEGYGGGGAGAGGCRVIASKTFQVTGGVSYTITVGEGGISNFSPGPGNPTGMGNGVQGGDSIFPGDLDTITSTGGGVGGNDANGQGPAAPGHPGG